MICNLCPRRCNSHRTECENINGFCKMPLLPRVARADLHFWEEPIISGKNGSGAVFFSGCSLACVYCQNYEISHNGQGKTVSYQRLAEIFRELELKNAHNINLVCPTHYAYAIKKALEIYRPNIPIVYNSGGYDSVETLKTLEGYIDIFLMDLKYMKPESAAIYSLAKDYPTVAQDAIKEALRQQPECVVEQGLMKKGVIIRHLLLPQATNEAISVFNWVRENAEEAYFSIMSQYTPCGKALNMPKLNRKITAREYEKVLGAICEFDTEKVFFQERVSASRAYIPDFNLSGV